jgi:hypothetical protein
MYIAIDDVKGQHILGIDSSDLTFDPHMKAGMTKTCVFEVESLPLLPGQYQVRLIIRNDSDFRPWQVPSAHLFEVASSTVYGTRQIDPQWHGHIAVRVKASFVDE